MLLQVELSSSATTMAATFANRSHVIVANQMVTMADIKQQAQQKPPGHRVLRVQYKVLQQHQGFQWLQVCPCA